jgi:LmbE family N-acetylglucosaminyl deacetylase
MNILAVGCHPDDLEIGCGGTLARYARGGHTVVMCIVANGNQGHAVIMPEALRAIRRAEALAAGERLGAAQTLTLDVPDLLVSSENAGTVRKLVEVIRRTRPDLIITHSPEDYMRDHVEVSRLVFDASFSASVPHFSTGEAEGEGGGPGNTPGIAEIAPIVPLYYMDTLAGVNFLPTEYVDVTETIEDKLEALGRHESQVRWMRDHDGIDFLDFVRTVAKFRGLQCGAQYAEGFRQCPTWPRLATKRLLP